jgi:hypothetical protein
MDYRITPVVIDGYADADGVYENDQGAWLGEIDDGKVMLYSDEDGEFIPAPANWRELIVKAL